MQLPLTAFEADVALLVLNRMRESAELTTLEHTILTRIAARLNELRESEVPSEQLAL